MKLLKHRQQLKIDTLNAKSQEEADKIVANDLRNEQWDSPHKIKVGETNSWTLINATRYIHFSEDEEV